LVYFYDIRNKDHGPKRALNYNGTVRQQSISLSVEKVAIMLEAAPG